MYAVFPMLGLGLISSVREIHVHVTAHDETGATTRQDAVDRGQIAGVRASMVGPDVGTVERARANFRSMLLQESESLMADSSTKNYPKDRGCSSRAKHLRHVRSRCEGFEP